MKTPIFVVTAISVVLVTLSGSAMAVDPYYKPKPKINLPANFQIQLIPVDEPEPAPQSFRQLCEGCEGARSSFRHTRRQLARKQRQCRAADYSRADQTAAGCTPVDTVSQCNAKLFDRCVKTERDAYRAAINGMHRACNALIESIRQDLNRHPPR
jgi:hypothetical protein